MDRKDRQMEEYSKGHADEWRDNNSGKQVQMDKQIWLRTDGRTDKRKDRQV